MNHLADKVVEELGKKAMPQPSDDAKDTEKPSILNQLKTNLRRHTLRHNVGGITGNQLGGGHGYAYWFYNKNDSEVKKAIKKEGDRKTKISHEVFAGYFEYAVIIYQRELIQQDKFCPKR